MSTLTEFSRQNSGAKLRLCDDTETRVAIKHEKRTIAYVAIARDLWGQLMVNRFNCHEELLTALKAVAENDPGMRPADWLETARAAIAKAEDRS